MTKTPEGLITDWSSFTQKLGAATFSPKPTAGTWQGQSQYFDAQTQARKVTEANNNAVTESTSGLEKFRPALDGAVEAIATSLLALPMLSEKIFGSHAEAAELSGGEISAPEIEKPEGGFFDDLFDFEGVTENLSSFGEMAFETLSGAVEGVGEIFSGLGESISENLSAAFDVASEMFSGFGESIGENLSAALDVANEMFSGFGELVSSSLTAAQSAAEGALAAIGAAFDSAKSAVQSAWSELPGFFSGIFDSLGGVASAAGAAASAAGAAALEPPVPFESAAGAAVPPQAVTETAIIRVSPSAMSFFKLFFMITSLNEFD